MIQIIVQAQKASCRKSSGEKITTGMVGKKVSFDFSADWDGLVKTAVFEGSGAAKDVVLTGDAAEIPHECLTVPGGMLRVGVFGTDGTVQTPTVYTDIGQIEQGADPSGDTSVDPTLQIWAQLQAMMGSLDNLTTTARDNLVAAINEAAKSGGGGAAADVKMQVAGGYIQYSSDGGKSWNNLIAMKELIGPTDETLTESGQAADAAVVGQKFSELSEEMLTDAELRNAVDNALTQAKESGDFTGAKGDSGVGIQSVEQTTTSTEDGGTNVVTVTKTDGTSSTFQVRNGGKGNPGDNGKSAYQYAQDGGYTGTEEEFAAKLAQEQLTGTTNDLTPTQVYDAVSAGIPVKVQDTNSTYGLLSFTAFNVAESLNVIVSQTIVYVNDVYILAELNGNKSDNTWGTAITILAQKTDIPSALPNPNALTFTGAVTGIYDGLEPVTVSIPSGGGVELLYTFELDEDDVVITSKSFLITPEIILEKYIEIFVLCDLTFGAGSEESGHFYINGIKFNSAEIKYFRRKENSRSVCLFVADRIGFSSSLFGLAPSRYAFYSGYNADSIDGIGVNNALNNLAKSGKISSIGFSSSSGFLLSTGSVIKIYGLKLG